MTPNSALQIVVATVQNLVQAVNSATQVLSATIQKIGPGRVTAINTQTADYILSLSDMGAVVEMNIGSANTLTVPPNSSVPFPVQAEVFVTQLGAGQTTFVAGSGVTILSESSYLKISGQYGTARLYQRAANVWVLSGNLSA